MATTPSDCGMSFGSVVIVSKSPRDSLTHSLDDTEANNAPTTSNERLVNNKQNEDEETTKNNNNNNHDDNDDVDDVDEELQNIMAKTTNHQFLLCRRSFKDAASGILRNCNSLPLFVYSTSPSTHITSADGVGLSAHATVATHSNIPKYVGRNECRGVLGCPDCLPLRAKAVGHLASIMMAASASANSVANVTTTSSTVPSVYHQPHTLNLNLMHFNNQQLQQQQHEHELSHKTPYSNNYPLHNHHHHHHHLHNGQHHQQQQQQPQQQAHQQQLQHSHMHSEQTKSLQELQHEVGALLEFRDLVIETFPDLKHKMASISSTPATTMTTITATSTTTTASNTLTGSCSLSSRREWEPGIRVKRKLSQKEASSSVDSPTTTSTSVVTSNNAQQNGSNGATAVVAAGELSSSSLTRSRSNSHSGKKEPKSAGENNNGSVVQDSGFSTETSSSKEGHSASSNNGAITGPNALHRLSCLESDDELLNLLDVIHRKSNRLREEMEHLQNYEKNHLTENQPPSTAVQALTKSTSHSNALTPRTFREHVERLNKEDIKQLRKERDKLLDKLAEMEAETLSGRIKATQMTNQMEELISVKKDLEEQLKMAMAQKLQLNVRVQQLQQQQQQKSSSSQSDSSSQRNFSSSATTVLSAGSGDHTNGTLNRRTHTFQPVVVLEQQQQQQNNGDRSNKLTLGRLDGIVSNPGALNTKCRSIQDSKRIAAILLETNVIELQRHLLTLSVQNQVLMQKLDGATKSKTTLAKRLDKSKEQVEDLCFQLEEKNIELAGTQAQLRIMETRIHANTPSSGAPTNVSSFMQHSSQHEYETNRSSTSTILTLSRRGVVNDSLTSSQPTVTQISTPSMKAMVPLAMDDMQQHGSSTESARDARHSNSSQNSANGSAFEQRQQLVGVRVQQTAKKFGGASKPSKIPLPGSKLSTSTTNYFTGKPPSGRPLSAIMSRSPNSTNASTASSSSNKSSLSRSTGNLLLSKSPNSLKRTDSAQSIRRDAVNISGSSLSTQNSRNSMNSSIPLAINTNNLSKSQQQQQQTLSHSTPSTTRVLQNSPLPKPKRESLTSRVRHLDSLSRVHKNNDKDISFSTPEQPSQLVSSTPKNGSSSGGLVTPVNSETHRKLLNDWATASTGSNNASYMQTLTRRGFRGATNVTTTPTTTTSTAASNNTNSNVANSARRFSSASMAGSTITTRLTNRQQDEHKELTQHQKQTQSQQQQQQQQQSSDTDSGKHSLLLYHKSPSICVTANKFHFPDPSAMNLWNDYSDDGLELTTTHLYPNSLSLLDANYLTTKTTTWGGNNNNDNIEGLGESDALSGMRNKLLVTFDYGSCSSLAHNGSSLNEFHPLHSAMVYNEIERKYFPKNYNDNKHDEHDDICTTLWYKALSKQKLTSSDMHFPVHHVQYAAHLIHDSQNSSINNQFTLNNYNNDNYNEDGDIESFHFRNSHKSPIKCISKDSLETYIANDYHDLHELNDENFYDEGEEKPDDDNDDDGGKLISENFYDSIEGL